MHCFYSFCLFFSIELYMRLRWRHIIPNLWTQIPFFHCQLSIFTHIYVNKSAQYAAYNVKKFNINYYSSMAVASTIVFCVGVNVCCNIYIELIFTFSFFYRWLWFKRKGFTYYFYNITNIDINYCYALKNAFKQAFSQFISSNLKNFSCNIFGVYFFYVF